MLDHSEKISRHGWTLESMTRLPEASKHGWKKSSGNQSLVGAIIYTGVEELGAKYILSDNGTMWQQCMPYLNMTPQDVYDKAIATGTPKCIKCDKQTTKTEPCFDCDPVEELPELALKEKERKATLRRNRYYINKEKDENIIKSLMRS